MTKMNLIDEQTNKQYQSVDLQQSYVCMTTSDEKRVEVLGDKNNINGYSVHYYFSIYRRMLPKYVLS